MHNMNKIKLYCIFLVVCLLAGCVGFGQTTASSAPETQAYWPSSNWRSSVPEEQGMDSELLAQMFGQIEERQLNMHSVLIVRNGYLVTEAYFDPYTQNQKQQIYSVTKSVISTLVGIAIQKGYIKDTDQTLVNFFPGRGMANLDERKKAITLKDLLTLTAGLTCEDTPFTNAPRMDQSAYWFQFMLDLPMDAQPGTKWNYCGGMVHLLSAILQETTGMSTRDFANRFLFEPMGIPNVTEIHWPSDPQGRTYGMTGLWLTPREMAKLGYLYLNHGKWNDTQIFSEDWLKEATTSYITRDNGLGYGYLWTVDPEKGYYIALCYAGQHIYVVPDKNLVIVFTAALPATKMNEDFFPLKALVDNYILPAVKSDQELPSNPDAELKLNAFISKAAYPRGSVPPLPEGAQQWSGVVYQMDENPYGWETMSFEIQPGSNTILVNINRQVVDIGSDHQFRIVGQSEPDQVNMLAPTALRGEWINGNTLLIKSIKLGEVVGFWGEIDYLVIFSTDEINLTGKYVVSGQEVTYHGKQMED